MKQKARLSLTGLLLGSIFFTPPKAIAAETDRIIAESEVCRTVIAKIEKEFSLPAGILQAISLAESGRWHRPSKARFAWPWTVTAHGKGKFYPSQAAAIAAVRQLKADGVTNIDVGCMQVNLHYHPKAFDSLDIALDPEANATYAAELFSKLRKKKRSISRAVAYYHSATRARNVPYKKKVMKFWQEERRRLFAERRLQKIAAWHSMRAQRQSGNPQAR